MKFLYCSENDEAEEDAHAFCIPSLADPKKRLYPVLLPSLAIDRIY